MDDTEHPHEVANTEVYIHEQLNRGRAPQSIIDDLLKKWDSGKLSISSKNVVARFCLATGFFSSLIRILKLDLRSGPPLPWARILELFSREKEYKKNGFPKSLTDAILSGAAHDHQLQSLAASALFLKDRDPRWDKILDSELKEHLLKAQDEKKKLFKEVRIFISERMDSEVISVLNKILDIFPADPEAKALLEKLEEQQLEVKIANLKNQYKFISPSEEVDSNPHWPNLDKAIKKNRKKLNVEEIYLLSIALFQMNLLALALETLRFAKAKWKIRERLWEVELLLSNKAYAEALSAAQIILNQHKSLGEVVKTALYYSAKALYGLGDREQGLSILRGISVSDPYFRDTSILLIEWTQ